MRKLIWLALLLGAVTACKKENPETTTTSTNPVPPVFPRPAPEPDYLAQYIGTYQMQDSVRVYNINKTLTIYKKHVASITKDSTGYYINNFWDQSKKARIVSIDSTSFYIQGYLPEYKMSETEKTAIYVNCMKFIKHNGKLIVAPMKEETVTLTSGFRMDFKSYFKMEKAF